jgi:hypothetical protein
MTVRCFAGSFLRGVVVISLVWVTIAFKAHPASACVGDCNATGTVDIDELIVGVSIALGSRPLSACEVFANAQGEVDIAQLIVGVSNALGGCTSSRFLDNGDGTISDRQTGLTWEKKVGLGAGADFANLHAADNIYPWAGACDGGPTLCQTNAAAAAACQQGAQGDQSGCEGNCPPTNVNDTPPCLLDGNAALTLWDWLLQLNAARFAGFSDWRLPTVTELQSIVDYTANSPAVDQAFHGSRCGPTCVDLADPTCSCTQSQPGTALLGPYWSATAAVLPYAEWWFVEFGFGGTEVGGNVGPLPSRLPSSAYVRAVRGDAAAPVPRFVDNGDGTITDERTGLMWETKNADGTGRDPSDPHAVENSYTWAGQCSDAADTLCQPNASAAAACARGRQADQRLCDAACEAATGLPCTVDPCATCAHGDGVCVIDAQPGFRGITTIWDWLVRLNAIQFAGYSDWRVPTEAELLSIADYTRAQPALDDAFGEPLCDVGFPTSCGSYWSATMADNCPSLDWLVTFDRGEVYSGDSIEPLRIRAVRGGV